MTDNLYYGETARSLKTRADAHFQDYQTHQRGSKRKQVSSWMWDHTQNHHGRVVSQDIRNDYTFRLQEVFRDPLSWQLDEAVNIWMVEGYGKVLGDRSEGVGGTSFVLNRKDKLGKGQEMRSFYAIDQRYRKDIIVSQWHLYYHSIFYHIEHDNLQAKVFISHQT